MEKNQSSIPPIVRLSVINPFLSKLQERGCNARQLLVDMALPPDIPASAEIFVPFELMYKLVEETAVVAKDQYFGFEVGREFNIMQWDAFTTSASMSATIGELLTRFLHLSGEHATTRFFLRLEPRRSVFGFERQIKPPLTPAQNDAFYVGMLENLIRNSGSVAYDAIAVLGLVSDPSAIPGSWRGRVGRTDELGPKISFPTEWNFVPCSFGPERDTAPFSSMPDSLLTTLRLVLRQHLDEEGLNAERAAALCGHKRRALSNELRKLGTTIGKQIAELKTQVAIQHLTETSQKIAEIGRRVGYVDATVFSRTFKGWTGQSPLEYRRKHKAPES